MIRWYRDLISTHISAKQNIWGCSNSHVPANVQVAKGKLRDFSKRFSAVLFVPFKKSL